MTTTSPGFDDFFSRATGFEPWHWQRRLRLEPWPTLLDIPTGLGKTAGVVVGWLHRRLTGCPDTPARLVYCLPMRALVSQTAAAARAFVQNTLTDFAAAGRTPPRVEIMMGGQQELGWAAHPEDDAVIIGTQDMLLSRALMRGYGMSRYAWPIHFAWLHNDALWVFDETQLMGVAVETGAQLEGLRQALGTARPARSLWMSATVSDQQLDTPDHPRPAAGWETLRLDAADHARAAALLGARKALARLDPAPPAALAARLLALHQPGQRTLVVVNRVARAQELYQALRRAGRDPAHTLLLHARFREGDRRALEARLHAPGDQIIVATQVVEAGLDLSARVLVTELAPWSSLVQRAGRCNRRGEHPVAEVHWIDLPVDKDAALPYEPGDLQQARELLLPLTGIGLDEVRAVSWQPTPRLRPLLRRRDLFELFDTTPELSGEDLDISRFVRDDQDADAFAYWRPLDAAAPDAALIAPGRDELCRVSPGALAAFAKKHKATLWRFDPLEAAWERANACAPGQTYLLDACAGGYDPLLGWTGAPSAPVPSLEPDQGRPNERMDDDRRAHGMPQWQTLTAHLEDVSREAEALAARLQLPAHEARLLRVCARWHDVGKAHEVFQQRLLGPGARDPDLAAPADAPQGELWAKSNHNQGRAARPGFRHELASALAMLHAHGEPVEHLHGLALALAVYLVAAHHGKVRLALRSLHNEIPPQDPRRRFARGVYDGDELPAVTLPGGLTVGPWTLDLSIMELGPGSWTERCQHLLRHPQLGPLRLGWWEALLRIADHRGSDLTPKEAP